MSSFIVWGLFAACCGLLLAITLAPQDFEYENELTLAYILCLAALLLATAYRTSERKPLENTNASCNVGSGSHPIVCLYRTCRLLWLQVSNHDIGLHAREQADALRPKCLLRRWIFITDANTVYIWRIATTEPHEIPTS